MARGVTTDEEEGRGLDGCYLICVEKVVGGGARLGWLLKELLYSLVERNFLETRCSLE